jgi:peroxiredoxin
MMVLNWEGGKIMVRKKIFFYSLFTMLFFFTPSFASERDREELFLKMRIQSVKGDMKAPNFCLDDLEGKRTELRNFKRKIIFLNFWATWCDPCKEEMPSIERLYQTFRGKDFIFMTISVDYEERKVVKKLIEKNHYTFLVFLDPKCEILDLYKVTRIPTTFIIDKNWKILGKATGPRDWKSAEAISLLNLLLER